MKEIKLYNRDGADLRLVSEDGNLWRFDVDKEHEFVLEYVRFGFNDDGSVNMIDPSGGPYLSVGQRISKDYVIDGFIDVDGHTMIKLKYCQV